MNKDAFVKIISWLVCLVGFSFVCLVLRDAIDEYTGVGNVYSEIRHQFPRLYSLLIKCKQHAQRAGGGSIITHGSYRAFQDNMIECQLNGNCADVLESVYFLTQTPLLESCGPFFRMVLMVLHKFVVPHEINCSIEPFGVKAREEVLMQLATFVSDNASSF